MGYRIGAVEYLNALPLVSGLAQADFMRAHQVYFATPSELFPRLASGNLDLALLSSITLQKLPTAYALGNYGIASVDFVASVGIFARVPIEKIKRIFLDKNSLTSVALLKILLRNYYAPKYQIAPELCIGTQENCLTETDACLIIGDMALRARSNFPYYYDLCQAWNTWTGLPFVFACWIATKPIELDFADSFDKFQAQNLDKIPQIIAQIPHPHLCDFSQYYGKEIRYHLDAEMNRGLRRFLQESKNFEISP